MEPTCEVVRHSVTSVRRHLHVEGQRLLSSPFGLGHVIEVVKPYVIIVSSKRRVDEHLPHSMLTNVRHVNGRCINAGWYFTSE